jgi:hypothetical protein
MSILEQSPDEKLLREIARVMTERHLSMMKLIPIEQVLKEKLIDRLSQLMREEKERSR